MKKLFTLLFTLALVFTVYAGNDLEKKPRATNYKQVVSNIVYPQTSREKGIEGTVVVMMNISRKGKIKSYEFLASPCSELQVAVEDVLNQLTFEPARDARGKEVAGKVALPINFKLTI